MASILKVDKLDPQSGTALEIGTSGDTISVPSGATLDISASTLTPPATMPASSAANLTNIPGANITGTIAAVSGANLTSLTATNLGSGTVPTARLGSGTASSSTVLYGDQTYKAEPGGDNTPYLYAKVGTATALNALSVTFPTIDNEIYDSGGDFASNTFTPSTAGYFYVQWALYIYATAGGNTLTRMDCDLKFNGSDISSSYFRNDDGFRACALKASYIQLCNGTSDYFTFQAYIGTSSGTGTYGTASAVTAYKLIT